MMKDERFLSILFFEGPEFPWNSRLGKVMENYKDSMGTLIINIHISSYAKL